MNRDKLAKLIRKYHRLAEGQRKALENMCFAELSEMVYNSNAIENSTLTLKDTEDIILRDIAKKDHGMREIFEALNLAKITKLLIQEPHRPLSVPLILHWHKILLHDVDQSIAGRFRHKKEWVRVDNQLGANPIFTDSLVSELVETYNVDDTAYFLNKIAHFHAEFEFIHPFNDGNGRIGRALINQQLMALDLPPIIIPNKGKRDNYYPLFINYALNGDYSGFTKLFLLLLSEALNKRIAAFTAKKVITVNDWAKQNNIKANTALNKAKRQVIPAFRVSGKWMIDKSYTQEM